MAVFSMVLNWAAYGLLLLLIPLSVAFLGYCLYIKYIHMKYDHIPGPPRDRYVDSGGLWASPCNLMLTLADLQRCHLCWFVSLPQLLLRKYTNVPGGDEERRYHTRHIPRMASMSDERSSQPNW